MSETHDPEVQAEVITDLTEHIIEIESENDDLKARLADLSKRLEEQGHDLYLCNEENDSFEARAKLAEQRLVEVEAALRLSLKYAYHDESCPAYDERQPGNCSCGWTQDYPRIKEALESVKSETPETPE